MAQLRRPYELKFHVTADEKEIIHQKMALSNMQSTAAYLRRMALNGVIVKLELPELREMVSSLRRSTNALNQIAKRVNSTGRVYQTDLQEIQKMQDKLWDSANAILNQLSTIS